jgi:predicted ester cyclase
VSHDKVRESLKLGVTPEEYREILELWKFHSVSEDNRDIEGLLATLTDDCVYELPQAGVSWRGKEGAAQFYVSLLTAFPDVKFFLENIVIGPQGVYEEASVVGTHRGKWLDKEPTGQVVTWKVHIFFPWDTAAKKFKGERVHFDGVAFRAQ